MKILHTVESYYPSTGGMQEVVKQLSERLIKLGHQVTVATSKIPQRTSNVINGVQIKEFDISGNLVRGLNGEVEKYQNFLVNSKFDVITNFAAQQWATDLAFDILDNIKAKKVFVPTGFSGLYFPKYKNYFESMRTWMKKYDMNIFLSNDYRDINFARKYGIKKLELIPNGASEEEFLGDIKTDIRSLLNISQNHFLVLLVGSHTGLKGHNESITIFSKSRINNATLLIVGNSFGGFCESLCKIRSGMFNLINSINDKKVIVTQLSRQETVDAYKTADLFLFPSNIECSPLVLFESMASNTPFLTTDVGNSLEIIKWSKSGILLPTIKEKNGLSRAKIKESADILERIYNDPQRRRLMAESGFVAWKKNFNWTRIANEYLKTYKQLIERK